MEDPTHHGALTTDLRTQLQFAVGNTCTLHQEPGEGGMSPVFVTTDCALLRLVVPQAQPPELARAALAPGPRC